jgi:hypothetical protein
MTDNQTTEIRSLLKERGVGYEPTRFSTLQTTFIANGIEWIVTEREATGELFVEPRHGLTPEQAIAATLGSEHTAHGMLTADQVRDTVEKHWHDLSADYDMPEATVLPEYSYNWQVISDELNAELGSGTCTPVETETLENVTAHVMECDECGHTYEHVNGDYGRCPHCGKVVER